MPLSDESRVAAANCLRINVLGRKYSHVYNLQFYQHFYKANCIQEGNITQMESVLANSISSLLRVKAALPAAYTGPRTCIAFFLLIGQSGSTYEWFMKMQLSVAYRYFR